MATKSDKHGAARGVAGGRAPRCLHCRVTAAHTPYLLLPALFEKYAVPPVGAAAAGGGGTIVPEDVAEAVLFVFRLSQNAVPEEIVIKPMKGQTGRATIAAA